jgi:hypothetical protein
LRAVEVFGCRETEMRGKDWENESFWCCWVEREKKVKKREKSMVLLQRAMSERGREIWAAYSEVGEVGLCLFIPLEWGGKEQRGGKEQINAKRSKNYKKAYAFS